MTTEPGDVQLDVWRWPFELRRDAEGNTYGVWIVPADHPLAGAFGDRELAVAYDLTPVLDLTPPDPELVEWFRREFEAGNITVMRPHTDRGGLG